MKIKCNDYLPPVDGDYETDLGVLNFRNHSKLGVWYKYTTTQVNNFKVINYAPVYPLWWDNPNIK